MPEGGRHSSDWIEELCISSIGGGGGAAGALTGVMLESAGCSPQGFASPGHSHGISLVGHGNGSVGGGGHGAGTGMNGGGMVVDDAFDEDLSVLPRHTKVIVTGNNRTKSVLVGLHGVVKKAVGLGGWHWLVLTNGLKVKLQRNALSVLEPPTGLEEDENDSEDMFPSRPNVVDEFSKPYKSRVRPHKPTSGTANKTAHKGHATDTSSTGSKTGGSMQGIANSGKRVNLGILETTSLLKYWRCYNLVETGPHPTREQLLDAVERHFRSQQLDEYQVIARFMQAAKRLKTVYG